MKVALASTQDDPMGALTARLTGKMAKQIRAATPGGTSQANLAANIGMSLLASALVSMNECPCMALRVYMSMLAAVLKERGLIVDGTIAHADASADHQGAVH